ncbi:MAG: DUF2680 domain-containing protein [Candidatus Bipolaricaulaceae bacterium]
MRKRGKFWLVVLVGLLALGSVGYVVYAQTTGENSSRSYLARVAEKLGVTEEALIQAMYDVRVDMIDEAVAQGKLTQAQADYLKAVLKARLEYWKAEGYEKGFAWGFGPKGFKRGFGRGFGFGPKDFGRGFFRGCPWWQAPSGSNQ